jgi:hypothetical protein
LSWQTTSGRYTSTPFQAAIAETATNGLVTASNPMALASVGPAVTIGDALNTEAK